MSHESYVRAPAPARSSDRTFGLVFAVFFAVIGTLPLIGARPPRLWALVVAGGFVVFAALFPALLAPLNRLWMRFGTLLHRVTNPIILGAMFFLVITPVALLMKALGKDPLRLRAEPQAKSYWIPREPPGPQPDTLKHQF